MANKTLNTRIQHKHDTEAHFLLATNFTPLVGELIIYDPDSTHTEPRIKIGDGVTNVNSLPFLAGSDITYVFNTAYDASTNKVATMADVNTALDTIASALVGGAW